jgi:hypothetical protein
MTAPCPALQIITEADIRLRKDIVRKWIRQAHDTFCACGCEASSARKAAEERKSAKVRCCMPGLGDVLRHWARGKCSVGTRASDKQMFILV